MSALDLFAGPGGWSEACRELGITEVGIEHDASACLTRAAAGHLTIRQDVTTLDAARFRPLDGLIASPPCPTFSAAGGRAGIAELRYLIEHVHACVTEWRPYEPPKNLGPKSDCDRCGGAGKVRGLTNDHRVGGSVQQPVMADWPCPDHQVKPDPRSALVLEPLRFALECVPQWIALEQVPDVLPVWEAYRFVLQAHGYSVWCGILNSADYGVPQTRRRAILMAHRRIEVSPPEPTHCEGGADTLLGELAPWVSMAAALGWGEDCELRERRGAGIIERHGDRAGRSFSEPASTIDAGLNRRRLVVDRRTNSRGPGGTTVDTVPVPVTRPAPTVTALAGGQWMIRAFDRPATTVCADPRLSPPGYRGKPEDYDADGNYTGSRSMDDALKLTVSDALKLTVSDALKLQSFRADYPVQGTKTKRFEQIGNAIPPLLARHVLASLLPQGGPEE